MRDKELREVLQQKGFLTLINDHHFGRIVKSQLLEDIETNNNTIKSLVQEVSNLFGLVLDLKEEISLLKELLGVEDFEALPNGLKLENKKVYFKINNEEGEK